MVAHVAADLLLLAHVAFVVFALAGAWAVARWPWLALLHVPAATWAFLVEWNGWSCPLTPWEQALRGEAGGGFIERLLAPLLYPGWLTPRFAVALALVVLAANVAGYGLAVRAWRRHVRT